MTHAKFNENGYDYLDKNSDILFSSDNMHNYLFDYVDANLSCLPEILEQYITQRIDTSDFHEKKYKNNIEKINKIKEILISAHPYYEYEYRKTIIKAIGNYFNELLLYSIFSQKTLPFDCTLKEDWYIEKFHVLIPSSLVVAGDYPNNLSPFDFYHKYKIWIDDRGYRAGEIEESFILNVPSEMPIGFSEELRIQANIRSLLFQTLNNISQPLKNLTNSDITNAKLASFYEIDNLQELLQLEITNMSLSNTVVKRCENCGKYFIPTHKSQKYCKRTDEIGLICAKAAKKKLRKDRLIRNPALKIYETAYKRNYARKGNGIISQQQFNSWQYKAKEKRIQVEKGTLDISIFQEWTKRPITTPFED